MNLPNDPAYEIKGPKWRATYTDTGWIVEYGGRRGRRTYVGSGVQEVCLMTAKKLNTLCVSPQDREANSVLTSETLAFEYDKSAYREYVWKGIEL